MRARGWFLIGLLVVAVLLLVGRTVTALLVDHAWYTAMDAPALFWEQMVDSLLLQGGAWLVGSAFAFANIYAVRRTIRDVAMQSRVANLEFTSMVPRRRLLSLTILASLIVGAMLAIPMTNWTDLALARHGLPFGEIEGILDRDLGFYVFWLPFEETLYLWSLVSVVALTAMVLVLYALMRSLRIEGRRVAASTHVRRHLSVLGALVLLLLAWSYRLDAFDLLQYGSGPDGTFLRVDHRFTLRVDWVLSGLCGLAALVVLRTGWTGQLRAAFATVTVVLIAAIGLRHIAPGLVARTDMVGESSQRDQDYVASRALFSRRAFEVDAIRQGTGALELPASTLALRTSLWDAHTLIGGLGAAVASAQPRAADAGTAKDSGPIGARPELAGRSGARARETAPLGWTLAEGRMSALLVRRPASGEEPWRLSLVDATRPAVRDSTIELAEAHVDDSEVPWPLVAPGVGGARLIDAGMNPGVPGASMSSLSSRIAHAWALRDGALLNADTLGGSRTLRIVIHRDIRERVERLAPVFVQGDEVYPVRDGDRLYWALHLYSASSHYPLSQRWQVGGGVYSYFKLAATAVVEASGGRVRLIPVERPDAIARTWMTRMPALFVPATAMPASLVHQLPPATDGATAQLRTFARYGSRLEGPVLRHLPDSVLLGGPPPPVAMDVGASTVMGWSVPLLDSGDEIDGVATATGGANRATYWTTATEPNRRWRTVLERLSGALDSARAAVPDGARRDNRLRLGRAEAVATSRGIFVVQPVLWTRGDGSLVVARVGVTDGDRVGIGATLAQALAAIGEPTTGAASQTGAAVTLLTPAPEDAPGRLYDSMRQALRRGDWSAFGTAFDSLGRVLGRPPQ